MKLPNWERAYIPNPKLQDYLLSETHPIGRLKAQYFNAAGFNLSNIESLEQSLLEIAYTQDIDQTITNEYGTKYILLGNIETPNQNNLRLTTVWIVDTGEDIPRFVTAYPQ